MRSTTQVYTCRDVQLNTQGSSALSTAYPPHARPMDPCVLTTRPSPKRAACARSTEDSGQDAYANADVANAGRLWASRLTSPCLTGFVCTPARLRLSLARLLPCVNSRLSWVRSVSVVPVCGPLLAGPLLSLPAILSLPPAGLPALARWTASCGAEQGRGGENLGIGADARAAISPSAAPPSFCADPDELAVEAGLAG